MEKQTYRSSNSPIKSDSSDEKSNELEPMECKSEISDEGSVMIEESCSSQSGEGVKVRNLLRATVLEHEECLTSDCGESSQFTTITNLSKDSESRVVSPIDPNQPIMAGLKESSSPQHGDDSATNIAKDQEDPSISEQGDSNQSTKGSLDVPDILVSSPSHSTSSTDSDNYGTKRKKLCAIASPKKESSEKKPTSQLTASPKKESSEKKPTAQSTASPKKESSEKKPTFQSTASPKKESSEKIPTAQSTLGMMEFSKDSSQQKDTVPIEECSPPTAAGGTVPEPVRRKRRSFSVSGESEAFAVSESKIPRTCGRKRSRSDPNVGKDVLIAARKLRKIQSPEKFEEDPDADADADAELDSDSESNGDAK